ncbi:MAG: PqiC family protein [Akkermansiaceae bacterium]|jgi:hypothetical protein|nr:PqiC family protein [Akkermansiaceae bacterium]
MSRISAIFVVAILLSCCAGQRSFYLLSADGPLPSAGGMGIGVGPVVLAEYLDRPNLVLQDAPHRLAVAEDHRWAGSLEASIARVTAANLGRRLGTGNVRVYPWTGDDGIARQVSLDIRQFHGGADGFAVLEAGWRVYQLPEGRLVASRAFTAREELRADGYDELVAAQSRLLSRLAAEIAQSMGP